MEILLERFQKNFFFDIDKISLREGGMRKCVGTEFSPKLYNE